MVYQYDALNRLISASGSGWTQTQAYDGFGNLTGRTGTGTAQGTTISTPTNATTNQLSGYTYDANGNLISTGYAYDAENRISSVNAGALEYFYDAQHKRIWEAACNPSACSGSNWLLQSQTINLFGPDGKQLASYSLGDTVVNNQVTVTFGAVAVRSYFGGRLVGQQLGANIYEPVIQDRLGSVGKYYPYGEERNSPQLPNDQVKFATYTRDSATGNDYADQRYYTSVLGRFMTPDPYRGMGGGSGDANNPQSWNRYAYVIGDPINWTDSSGKFYQPPEQTPNPPPPPFVDTSSPPSNQVTGKAPKQNLPNSPIPCPPVPQAGGLPAAASAIIAQNIALAQQMSQQFFQEAEQDANSDPDAPVGLIYFDLMANWLVQQFSAGGAWDYKAQQDLWAANAGTTNLQNFGNFNFGAVMQSLGLSYYLTQNAAGIYQMFGIGQYTQGIPLIQWPFGDTTTDANVIKQGYNYEVMVEKGCK